MYVLELAGEDDSFAIREAASAASGLEAVGTGLAVARAVVPRRVRGLAFTHRVSEFLGRTSADVPAAQTLLRAAPIDRDGTVSVRARDVRSRAGVDTQQAERELGAVLVDRGFSVDLEDPDHELRALFAGPPTDGLAGESTDEWTTESEPTAGEISGGDGPDERGSGDDRTDDAGVCVLGWLSIESVRGFGKRAPTEKPFFQPGSMDPLLARALANVAGAAPGRTLLDPMCGTGGMLVEAGLVGADVLGVDAQPKMVRGARENLRHYLGGRPPGSGRDGDALDGDAMSGDYGRTIDASRDGMTTEQPGTVAVLRGDATRLPVGADAVDGVVFDAPYGRQSAVERHDRADLVRGALAEAVRVAPRAVVVGDRPFVEAARAAGWTVESVFERRVHRSLTRHVHVLERADVSGARDPPE